MNSYDISKENQKESFTTNKKYIFGNLKSNYFLKKYLAI